jgi:acyl-CoA synthetase (AMP-forming)/AMP-acid ligase II
MEGFGQSPAIVWGNKVYNYEHILQRMEFWEKELISIGIDSGKIVSIEADYSPNACSLLLALIENKSIVVPLTQALKANRQEFLKISEAQYVITFNEKDEWQVEERDQGITNSLSLQLIEEGAPGLVLFSSGSTGKSKASLHNFEKILDKFKVTRKKMRVMNFLLFDHIGGINTLFYTFSNGGMVVTTSSRNPEKICQLIEEHRIELLPTTPTFLNLLLISEAYRNYDLSSLKLITYGTEVMSESVLERLHRVFPGVQLLQTYGLSELGILRSKSKSSDSLWVKMGGEGFETKVVDGILWIRAHSAMMGYLNRPSPFTDDGWFITGDAVEVDGEYFRILGRDSEMINVGGEKVFPAEVESVLQSMENVGDVAVSSEPNPITGQIVKAAVFLTKEEKVYDFKKRMKLFCKDKLQKYKIPQKVIISSQRLHSERFKKMRKL